MNTDAPSHPSSSSPFTPYLIPFPILYPITTPHTGSHPAQCQMKSGTEEHKESVAQAPGGPPFTPDNAFMSCCRKGPCLHPSSLAQLSVWWV
ncbi:hypothetical protein OYC64_014579 [Pagothenia borchgrevinki]|uniref:Uncharacterized protein n=1 Tax=Pagothenia borchgrevinki TaxID=8213 RepID=A0ABD2H2D1_PAGBO